jgi:hypothetical protein
MTPLGNSVRSRGRDHRRMLEISISPQSHPFTEDDIRSRLAARELEVDEETARTETDEAGRPPFLRAPMSASLRSPPRRCPYQYDWPEPIYLPPHIGGAVWSARSLGPSQSPIKLAGSSSLGAGRGGLENRLFSPVTSPLKATLNLTKICMIASTIGFGIGYPKSSIRQSPPLRKLPDYRNLNLDSQSPPGYHRA